MFRIIVQDTRRTPTSGKVVAQLGHYDPHTKAITVDKEKATVFLSNGAQPSERVARLLKAEGVKLPEWVTLADKKTGVIRNAEKLRRNQPKEAAVEEKTEEKADETAEAPAETPTETVEQTEEAPVEAATEEAPAETPEEVAPADTEKKA